jgi:hypothetical protein
MLLGAWFMQSLSSGYLLHILMLLSKSNCSLKQANRRNTRMGIHFKGQNGTFSTKNNFGAPYAPVLKAITMITSIRNFEFIVVILHRQLNTL